MTRLTMGSFASSSSRQLAAAIRTPVQGKVSRVDRRDLGLIQPDPEIITIYRPWHDRLVVLPFGAITKRLGGGVSRHRNVFLEVRIDSDSVEHATADCCHLQLRCLRPLTPKTR
jgi:hypothetical protein